MTTAVWSRKEKILVADRKKYIYQRTFHQDKVRLVPWGNSLAACVAAGNSVDFERFIRWLNTHTSYPENMDETYIMLLTLQNELLYFAGDCDGAPMLVSPDEGYFAIGSGSDVACGALSVGAKAGESIFVAAEHNLHTGGGVMGYQIKDGGWEEVMRSKKKGRICGPFSFMLLLLVRSCHPNTPTARGLK